MVVSETRGDLKGFTECVTAWDGLSDVKCEIADLARTVAGIENTTTDESLKIIAFDEKLNQLRTGIKELSDFVMILDQEQQAGFNSKGGNASGGSDAHFMHIQDDLMRLSQQFMTLRAECGPGIGGSSTTDGSAALAEVAALKLQVKLLEARLPNDNNMSLGGAIFKSRNDVSLFVETKMPSNSFLVFHEVMTLMESLSGGHIT
mmetsp:Transcript_15764/g.22501  ORF Transcript_15764/g.22501 Transcript_15764/m.22501 type:complete len:204 (-) Transcript_15764:659-1270(-)